MPEQASPVSMVERMTLIMGAFDATSPRLTLAELAERTGLPRSTTHRILDQLVTLRWLEHSGQSYALGLLALELGGLAAAHHTLRDIAAPLLASLHRRTGAVAHLVVLDRRDVVFIDRVGSGLSSDTVTRVGGRAPAHATAAGKALLAWADEAVLVTFRGQLTGRTPRTITSLEVLRQDLLQVRGRGGIAYEREEMMPGSCAVAVALRGPGRPFAALQLSGDSRAMGLERLGPILQETAQQASRALFPYVPGRRRSRTVDRTPVPSAWPPGALDRLVQGIGGDYWL